MLHGAVLLGVLAACSGKPGDAAPSGPPGGGPTGAWLRDRHAVSQVLAAARREIAATSSYDYRHLERFRRQIRAGTTGPLTATLLATVDTAIVTTGARLRVRQVASVSDVGIGGLSADGRASVLAFGDVTVHNTTYPRGRRSGFTLVAQLREVDGRWLLAALDNDGELDAAPPGTAGLAQAAAAGARGLRGMVTFSRARFAADFAGLLAATTGPLHREVAASRARTLHTLRAGGFDMTGVVRAHAVESASGGSVVLLARVDGIRVSGGRRSPATRQSLRATVVWRHGRWLLADVSAV